MVTETLHNQLTHIRKDLEWLVAVINARMDSYFNDEGQYLHIESIPPPDLNAEDSYYAEFIIKNEIQAAERIVLLLTLIPHMQPQILDVFFTKNQQYERGFTEFGGIKGHYFNGFMPTGETALFILAANDLDLRAYYSTIFDEDHFFAKNNIIRLENPHNSEPFLSGSLVLSADYVDFFCYGKVRKPAFSGEFPAKKLETQLTWNELVLDANTAEQISEIHTWIQHGETLLNDWGLASKIKPGYRSLFYGPPGTGKTLTATLLGKSTGREVYRVDLSMIVSKFIGETEKNLSKVFDKAAGKEWILFFDEADALFGKRTSVADAHDRYANQEVSFLLQKIEDHNGLVILATNIKSNIDEAFTRRFQSIIHFPMPKSGERLTLWKRAFSEKSKLEEELNLKQIAENYVISGGSIMNVVRYASLMALKNNTNIITKSAIISGIRKEFQKEGKTI